MEEKNTSLVISIIKSMYTLGLNRNEFYKHLVEKIGEMVYNSEVTMPDFKDLEKSNRILNILPMI